MQLSTIFPAILAPLALLTAHTIAIPLPDDQQIPAAVPRGIIPLPVFTQSFAPPATASPVLARDSAPAAAVTIQTSAPTPLAVARALPNPGPENNYQVDDTVFDYKPTITRPRPPVVPRQAAPTSVSPSPSDIADLVKDLAGPQMALEVTFVLTAPDTAELAKAVLTSAGDDAFVPLEGYELAAEAVKHEIDSGALNVTGLFAGAPSPAHFKDMMEKAGEVVSAVPVLVNGSSIVGKAPTVEVRGLRKLVCVHHGAEVDCSMNGEKAHNMLCRKDC